MIYFSILLVLFFLWVLNIKNNTIEISSINSHTYLQLVYIIVVAIFFVLFLGLRGLTGTDTATYFNFYYSNIYPDTMEKVYLYISRLFSSKGISFDLFQIFIATITITSIFTQYWKKSKNIYFTILLFYLFTFYLYAFNVSRQTLAASVLTLAYLSCKKGNKLSYITSLILCLTSIGIHKTSLYIIILLIITNFVTKYIISKNKILLFFGLFSVFISLMVYKSDYVFNKLLSLSSNLGDYSSYVDGASSAMMVLTNKSLTILLVSLISGIIIMIYSLYPIKIRDVKLLTPFLLFAIFNMLQVSWISDRMSIFMLPIIPLFFTQIIYIEKYVHVRKTIRIIMFILILTMGILMFSRFVLQNFGQIVPYRQ